MPIAIPGGKEHIRGRRTRQLRPIRASRRIQLAVRKELLQLADELHLAITPEFKALITAGDFEAVQTLLDSLRVEWRNHYGKQARRLAGQWVGAADAESKRRFSEGIKDALGVDFAAVFDSPHVIQTAKVMGTEAAELIGNMPEQYLDDIQDAVLKNYLGTPLPEGRTLIEQIEEIYKVSRERAAIIAHDQTSKINTAVTQARFEDVGIDSYTWRTAGDIRVVGTPGGLFPKGNKVHGDHFAREGKRFYWREHPKPEDGILNPPEDGPPGWAINCRCVAQAMLDVDRMIFA